MDSAVSAIVCFVYFVAKHGQNYIEESVALCGLPKGFSIFSNENKLLDSRCAV